MYVTIGGLAAVENIFPPIPADTAVALGAFLSHYGTVSVAAIFAVTWITNVASASLVYVAGRTLGRSFFTGRMGSRLLAPAALARLEHLHHAYGVWGILLSRFIPGVRAVVPPFAGIARLDATRALIPIAVASAVWYGTLTFLVARFAGTLEDVILVLDRLNRAAVALAVSVAVVLGIVVWRGVRRRHRHGSRKPDTPFHEQE